MRTKTNTVHPREKVNELFLPHIRRSILLFVLNCCKMRNTIKPSPWNHWQVSDYLEITIAVVVPCEGPKSLPVHRYSVVIFTFLVLWDYRVQHLFETRVALNTGLGGMRDVASVTVSHEQTQ